MPVAPKNRVVQSFNQDGETRCVDVFMRPDGTYGFEEYRRELEDGRGWFAIGGYAGQQFVSFDAALHAAAAKVPWLESIIRS
ncbi:MAG: hypothetical protein EKK41_22815 [Hyphomicrobiales bacterium]|nr:MAG: hypothetical protein EKK41_22815 [Hyphomicrobiales bacterium]